MRDRRKPACMTVAEYGAWNLANAECNPSVALPCWDCPLAWALEQEAKGDCLVWNGLDYVLGDPSGDVTEGGDIIPMPKAERARRTKLRRGQRTVFIHGDRLDRLREAWKLHLDGLSARQIATKMGVHKSTIHVYIRDMRTRR